MAALILLILLLLVNVGFVFSIVTLVYMWLCWAFDWEFAWSISIAVSALVYGLKLLFSNRK